MSLNFTIFKKLLKWTVLRDVLDKKSSLRPELATTSNHLRRIHSVSFLAFSSEPWDSEKNTYSYENKIAKLNVTVKYGQTDWQKYMAWCPRGSQLTPKNLGVTWESMKNFRNFHGKFRLRWPLKLGRGWHHEIPITSGMTKSMYDPLKSVCFTAFSAFGIGKWPMTNSFLIYWFLKAFGLLITVKILAFFRFWPF